MSSCHLVILSVLLLLAAAPLQAHPVPRRAHDRVIGVTLRADAVVVNYRLEVDPLTVLLDDLPAVEDLVDLKKFTRKEEFYDAYIRCYAPILAERLDARLDGQELAFTCTRKSYSLLDEEGKPLDHLRCDFVFQAVWKVTADKRHELRFREGNFELEEGRIQLSLTAATPIDVTRKTQPDKALQARPTTELKPGDDERLRRAAASFRVAESVSSDPASAPNEAADQTAAVDAGYQDLFALLLDSRRGFWVLVVLAAGFGAVHALTPGHGKALVAAYLVGERGTAWHALLLGLVTTLTHTGAVLILALGLRLYFPKAVPADVQAALRLVGGLLIMGMGFWLFLRRLTRQPDHFHAGGHAHHHHDHDHHHDHYHDDPGHVHPLPSPVSTWGLVVLGVSGGIVPCWDAIAMLLFAISADRLALALPMLLAFSVGLAAVLVAIGLAVVYVKNLSESRWGTSRLFQALPLVSAGLIFAMGLWLCANRMSG